MARGCATRALAHSSFLLLWSAVLIMYPTSLAVISMTFSNYVLQPVFPNCIPPATASRVLSMACLSEYPSWGWAGPLLSALCAWAGGRELLPAPERSSSGKSSLQSDCCMGCCPPATQAGLGCGPPWGAQPQAPPACSLFLPSAPDVGEQLQRALGHAHPGCLHRREAASSVTHHLHGLCPDLPR